MAAAGGTLSTGHHPRCVQLVCCSPALHGAYSASRLRSPGGAQSRESLTQDSRSAVKARLSDPCVDHSWKALHLPAAGVAASQEAVTKFRALGHARKRREYATTMPMRAYVTSGDPLVDDARKARLLRATASRHIAWRAQGSPTRAARRTSAQHAPHGGGALRVGLRGWRATPALLCRRRGGSGGNAQGSRLARWSPSVRRGRATANIAAAHGHRAAPTTLEIAPRRADPASSAGPGTSLPDALASTTEATRQPCSVSLEELNRPGIPGDSII